MCVRFLTIGFLMLAMMNGRILAQNDDLSIRGHLFLDKDQDQKIGNYDVPLGAVGVEAWEDRNSNGSIDSDDPMVGSYLSDPDGFYEINIGSLNISSQKIAVSASSDDAVQQEPGGIMVLDAGTMSGVREIGLRFDGLELPQGAEIVSASLRIKAATEATGITEVIIRAQDSDAAATFSDANYDIYNRPRTSNVHAWISPTPVLENCYMKMDGFESVISEVVQREGWAPGNPMVLIIGDFFNDIYTFDSGFAPELTISWIAQSPQVRDYIIRPSAGDLAPETLPTTDMQQYVRFSAGQSSVANIDFGFSGTTSICYAASGEQYDGLHIINRISGNNKFIGSFGGEREIDALALNRDADLLYAADGHMFGTIDRISGQFTAFSELGSGNGSQGIHLFSHIDGLHYDLTRNVLWATERMENGPDLITTIDPATGSIAADAFGTGVDYIVADGGSFFTEVEDIAADPTTGLLYLISHSDVQARLIRINPETGNTEVVVTVQRNYLQGLTFHNDGTLYATTGTPGTPGNLFYKVDKTTGDLQAVGYFLSENDFEGCDCQSEPATSVIKGHVFIDDNEDGVRDESTEPGSAGLEMILFNDKDGSESLTPADEVIATTQTDENGGYELRIGNEQRAFITADLSGIENAEWTTAAQLLIELERPGDLSFRNDLGYTFMEVLTAEEIFTTDGELDIWPNPSTGPVFVSLPGTSSANGWNLLVTDIAGRVVEQSHIRNTQNEPVSYDLTSLASGTYVFVITDGLQRFTAKVVKPR